MLCHLTVAYYNISSTKKKKAFERLFERPCLKASGLLQGIILVKNHSHFMPGRNYPARPTFLNNYPNWNGKRPTKKASAEVVLVETVEEVLAIFCQTSPNGRIQLKSRFGLHYPPLRSGVFHYTLSNFKFKQKWLYILMYTVYTLHSTSTVLKTSQYL